MLKIGESGWLEKENPSVGLWTQFINRLRLQFVYRMCTPCEREPLRAL